MASLIGVLYGQASPTFPNGKSLVGVLSCGITCMGVGWVYHPPSFDSGWIVVNGIAGAIAEVCNIPNLDDNFTMPLLSGILFRMIREL